MRAVATLRALGPVDVRSVKRDAMLRWLVLLMPGVGLIFRYAIPVVTELLRAKLDFDLEPYYALVMSFLGVMVGGLLGTVVGFLFLDQRDDRTLPALLVTPLTLNDYLAYRLAVPMVLGVALTAILFPLAGLTELSVLQVVVTAVCAAPIGPMYALFIGGFAANKVQGFALSKAVGILFVPVVVAWFVEGTWQLLFGIVPLYWPLKVFWLFDGGEVPTALLYAAVGLAYHGLLLWWLARRLGRVVRGA